MCGGKSKTLLLGSVFFLLVSPAFSLDDVPEYSGPDLPQGWHPIHENEIERLRTLNENLREQLNEAESDLKEAESDKARLNEQVTSLTKSLRTSREEVRRNRWQGRLEGAAIAIVVRESVGLVLTLRR